jgi:hypothetical protein
LFRYFRGEMGGFVFCDRCVEAAAEIVADKKAGR